MPVYNGERFIRKALDSLLAQTFTDFELIISDNASSDRTEAICREYVARDPRVRYVRQSENRGALANFQFVLDEAAGEYFMWAAADDVWDSKFIEILLPVSSGQQCLAYGCVQTIDENGNKISHPANGRKLEFSGNRVIRRCRYFIQPGFLGKANPIYGIMPISYLREDGINWLEVETCGGDMILLYVLLRRIDIKHGGGVVLYKRIHRECAGGRETKEIGKPNVLTRLIVGLKGIVTGPMVTRYLKHSSAIESMCLAALYPACITLSAGYAIGYKMQRMVRRDWLSWGT